MKKQFSWLAAAVLVAGLGGGAQAQPVYKWVDAEGKTHYGSQPPPSKADAEPMKLQGTNGTGGGAAGSSSGKGSANARAKQEYNPTGRRRSPRTWKSSERA